MPNNLNNLNNKDRLIKGSRLVVRTAIVLNRLFLAAVVVGLLLSWIFPAQFVALLLQPSPGTDVGSALTGVRLLILLGLAMAVVTDRLLAALAQIIASAGAGDPFISANARRLQTIGWALLTLQLLDIPGLCSRSFSRAWALLRPTLPSLPEVGSLSSWCLCSAASSRRAPRCETNSEGTV